MSLEDYKKLTFANSRETLILVDAMTLPVTELVHWHSLATKAHDSAVANGRSGKYFAKVSDYLDMLVRLRWDSCGYITIEDREDLYSFKVAKLWETSLQEVTEDTELLSEIADQAGETDPQRSVKRSLFHLYRVVGGLMHFATIKKVA